MNSGLSLLFRALLLLVSLLTSFFFLHKIKKAKVRMQDCIFWLLFSGVLIVLSLFPDVLSFFSNALQIQSPANFLFLVIIFLLLLHQFILTLRVSMLENKLNQLGRRYALDKNDEDVL